MIIDGVDGVSTSNRIAMPMGEDNNNSRIFVSSLTRRGVGHKSNEEAKVLTVEYKFAANEDMCQNPPSLEIQFNLIYIDWGLFSNFSPSDPDPLRPPSYEIHLLITRLI